VLINQSFSVKCVVDSTKHLSESRVDQLVVLTSLLSRIYNTLHRKLLIDHHEFHSGTL
jgi:hypothetical protein